jgi:Protein of unknown function (DUF3987)
MSAELRAEIARLHWQRWEVEQSYGAAGAAIWDELNGSAMRREESATSAKSGPEATPPRVVAHDSLISQPQDGAWPTLDLAAYHGLAGQVVRTLTPETEADPAGLLLSFLTGFGNLVGPGPRALVGSAPHPARLNAVLVGDTARARKGTSWSETGRVLAQAAPDWHEHCEVSGLSSGEGLINEVRDDDDRDRGLPAHLAKARLIYEGEFVRVLKVCAREGNILSTVLRDAWDGRPLRSLTRRDPLKATGAHLSILAHITAEELRRHLTETDAANGFANRFLFCLVRRTTLLPNGGNLDPAALDDLARQVEVAANTALGIGILRRTTDADAVWADAYRRWATEAPGGLAGAIVARADAQTLRLSTCYALLDGSPVIDVPHVQAALALWRYCEASALYLFGDALGDPVADRLLEALRDAGDAGLDSTGQHAVFGRHVNATRLAQARAELERRGLVVTTTEKNGGRPRIVSRAVTR